MQYTNEEGYLMEAPIKYVGSKRGLADIIYKYVPNDTSIIFENFSGSGAFSFSSGLPFYLSDSQPELVNFFSVLEDNVAGLVLMLEDFYKTHSKEFYLSTRAQDRLEYFSNMSEVYRAARYYYIIYSGFNGLYRVNSKGQCNTPWGDRKFIIDRDKLERASLHLDRYCRGISCNQFDDTSIIESAISSGEKPFVLIDPPYVDGDNGKKVYREYTTDIIDDKFYDRLELYMKRLDRADIPFLMTNTYCEYIKDKFSKWNIDKVTTSYKVAADKTRRGDKFEAFTSNI